MSALERIETAPANIQPHPATDSGSLLQIISRAASDASVDIDKMERLLQMHERLVARDAEQAFNAAMTAAQGDMGRISADASNPQTKSRYATYGKLDQILRPIYTRHGFALSFDTGEGAPADCVRVLAHVSHCDGHTRTYHTDMPADGKGAKGGDVMTKTHATGAAMSYGMRYLLKMIFNVAIGEEDRDGNGDFATDLTKPQVDELLGLIGQSGTDIEKFCAAFKVAAVAQLHAKNFEAAKNMLLTKLLRKQGAQQ